MSSSSLFSSPPMSPAANREDWVSDEDAPNCMGYVCVSLLCPDTTLRPCDTLFFIRKERYEYKNHTPTYTLSPAPRCHVLCCTNRFRRSRAHLRTLFTTTSMMQRVFLFFRFLLKLTIIGKIIVKLVYLRWLRVYLYLYLYLYL